jgi:polysaccharide biosynthesis transport protein
MSKNFELLSRIAGGVPATPVPTPPDRPQVHPPVRPMRKGGDRPELVRALDALRQYWRWSVGFAAVVIITTAITVFVMKPVYEPLARIEVDPPGTESFALAGAEGRGDPVQYLQTQTRELESEQLAIDVIRALHLAEKGNFGSSPVDMQKKDADDNGAKKKDSDDHKPLVLNPAESRALGQLQSNLKVRLDSGSWLINVSFASHDPELAAVVTNAVVQTYIDNSSASRHQSIIDSTQWLSQQLEDIRGKMESSQRALADFRENHGLLEVGPGQNSFSEKMAELNRQLGSAQAERIQLQALLRSVGSDSHAAVPQMSSEPVVQELEKQLNQAKVQLDQALVVYGKNHPNVRKLQAQVHDLEQQLTDQRRTIVANLQTSYAAAHGRENLLRSQLAENSSALNAASQYEALKKEAEANEELYNTLYSKVKEGVIAAEGKSNNIRWVDHARVLRSPTRPQRTMLLLASVLAGLIGGILIAFVRKALDARLHTLEELRDWTGVPNLVVLPRIEERKRSRVPLLTSGDSGPPEAFLLERPESAEAEALRSLLTSLHLSQRGPLPQAILITSSFPGEGKTTVAINLGVQLSRRGRTCLMEADLRRPMAVQAFGITSDKTLADVLRGNATLDEALVEVPSVSNLSVLPAGHAPEWARQLSESERVAAVIRDLRYRFDYIVVDSPPVLPYADARALSTMVDGVIFVGRAGLTTREALERSFELLAEVHSAPLLQVVLNGVEMHSSEYRIHYGYNYNR